MKSAQNIRLIMQKRIRALLIISFFVSLGFLLFSIYWYLPTPDKIVITLASTFNGFCALAIAFSDRFFKWLDKPKLQYEYNKLGIPPYRTILGSHPYTQEFILNGDSVLILRPTAAIRLKITNDTDVTVKSAIAKLEKIEFTDEHGNKGRDACHYHPTDLKWAGELDWNSVDILPHSHHFLDLFRIINEQKEEILKTNSEYYRNRHDEEMLTWAINRLAPNERIHWNVWVKDPESRGIPSGFLYQGVIILYFVINSDNGVPLKLEASINWSASQWDNPSIEIKESNRHA